MVTSQHGLIGESVKPALSGHGRTLNEVCQAFERVSIGVQTDVGRSEIGKKGCKNREKTDSDGGCHEFGTF